MMPYYEWNRLLLDYFFNYENEGRWLYNLFIDRKILNDLAVSETGYEDFIKSIDSKINRGADFFSEFENLYEKSQQKYLIDKKVVTRKTPEYFGFLLFLIFALTEGDNEKFNISNIYGRINTYGERVLSKKWKHITSQISKDILDKAWVFLEDWANKIQNGKLGFFRLLNTGSKIYARRIARHVLFHQGHLSRLLDVLVEKDVLPGEEILNIQLINLLKENGRRIGISDFLIDILSEDSDLAKNMLSIIKGLIKDNYTERTRASTDSKRSIPPIPLKLVLNLPTGFSKNIQVFGIRAYSHELIDDKIRIASNEYPLDYEINGLSAKVAINPFDLSTNIEYFSEETKQRFLYFDGPKWLLKNHVVSEWVETNTPYNDNSFLLFAPSSFLQLVQKESYNNYKQYSFPVPDRIVLKFEKLSAEQFKSLIRIVNPECEYEGKIQVHGAFLADRRTTIYKDFDYSFEYKGDIDIPILHAKVMEDESWYCLTKKELIDEDGISSFLWKLPDDFPMDKKFKVFEINSNVQSHFTYKISYIRQAEPTKRNFYLKDKGGEYIGEANNSDIFDLPNNFVDNGTSNLVRYLSYQKPIEGNFIFYHKEYGDYLGKIVFDYRKNDKGNLLLNYLNSNPNINTTEFYQLIQYLNSSINIQTAKRIMYYWRYLGYLDFKFYGSDVSVNQSSLLYLQTDRGIKTYLTGARKEEILIPLGKKCKELGLKLISEEHNLLSNYLLPQKIVIYDSYAMDLKKIEKISAEFELVLNKKMIVYQLAAFYYQIGVSDFLIYLGEKDIYDQKHHRKQYFDILRLKWEETTKDINSLDQPALIRYDGFNDNSIKHVFISDNIQYVLPEYSLAVFYLLSLKGIDVLKRKVNPGFKTSDLYIPIQLPLPYWIEKGLVLSNATIPYKIRTMGIDFRIYEKIPDSIIELIEGKLSQKIDILNNLKYA